MAKGNEEKAGTALAAQQKGGALATYDYGQEAGAGFENGTSKDLSIPFMAVLQAMSPQVENNSPEGSKAGMLFNTVTGELIDGAKGIVFLPVHKDVALVEWVPRNKGGGFVGVHDPAGELAKAAEARAAEHAKKTGERGKLLNGENELIETHYCYGLLLDDEGKAPIGFGVIAFTSTKIKHWKKFYTSMLMLKGKPPMFANRARIKTFKDKNEKGTFYNVQIEPLRDNNWTASLINPQTEGALLDEARSFRDMVISGIARADFSQQNATGDGGETVTNRKEGEAPPF